MAWEVSDMIIHRIHYRCINTYLACYFYQVKRGTSHTTKLSSVAKLKKAEKDFTKSGIKLIGAMA